MALDCEMDLNVTNLSEEQVTNMTGFTTKNPGLVLKVSMVNEQGETVLDTLVDYSRYLVFKQSPQEEQTAETEVVQVAKKEREPKVAKKKQEK